MITLHFYALKSNCPVLAIFIFDTTILNKLENKNDSRVNFIHKSIEELHKKITLLGSTLLVLHGKPEKVFEELITKYNIANVFTNNDYEPYALERDNNVKRILEKNKIAFITYKDHVIFEKLRLQKKMESHIPYLRLTVKMENNFAAK